MSQNKYIQLNKELLVWALRESQKDDDEIRIRFPRVVDWISGEKQPTFKQLEQFAQFTQIPFGYLFLDQPPEQDTMAVEFRSIQNKLPHMSKNLKDTILSMDLKQTWMHDYRKNQGWEQLDFIDTFEQNKAHDVEKDAVLAKNILGLGIDWYSQIKNYREAYNLLKEKMEAAGVLVMQNGVVDYNNRRKLDIHEFRAFLLYDDLAPIIFINNNDSIAGKIFSLVHEFFHVLYRLEDVFFNADMKHSQDTETHMNCLTSAFLIPEDQVKIHWRAGNDPFVQIATLADLFKVSQTALAIALKAKKRIDQMTLDRVIEMGITHYNERRISSESGGHFYNTFNSRISPTFTQAVIRSAEAGETPHTDAFRLLGGIKGRTYDTIKEKYLPYV